MQIIFSCVHFIYNVTPFSSNADEEPDVQKPDTFRYQPERTLSESNRVD